MDYKTYFMTALIVVKLINYFSGPNTYLHVCGAETVRVQNVPLPIARLLCQHSVQMILFASQIIFVLHDCLNPTGGVPKSQRQVIVYDHERTLPMSTHS